MKVCDLTQADSARSGGVLTYLEAKQKYMSGKSQHSHVVVIPGKSDQVEYIGNTTIYQIGTRIFPWGKRGRGISRMDKVVDILKREKPDVVELGSPVFLPYAGFYCRRHFSSVLVGFCHNEPSQYLGEAFRNGNRNPVKLKIRWIWEKYACSVYNRCDSTITASKYLREKLRCIGVERVINIRLGVDLDIFHPGKRNPGFRRRLGIGEHEKILVYAGRLDKDKRIHILLDAFQLISPHFKGKLIIVGDGPDRKEVLSRIRCNSKIMIYPHQKNRSRLAEILASSDIYVSAGPYETFALSVIEAQACGLPVAGVASGALEERVSPASGILGPKDSPQSLAVNIMKIASRDIPSMRKESRYRVEKEFSWKKTFADLFRLYSRLRNQNGK